MSFQPKMFESLPLTAGGWEDAGTGKEAWRGTQNLLSLCLLCVLRASAVKFLTVLNIISKER